MSSSLGCYRCSVTYFDKICEWQKKTETAAKITETSAKIKINDKISAFSQALYIGSHAFKFFPTPVVLSGSKWPIVAKMVQENHGWPKVVQYFVSEHYPQNLVNIFLGKPNSVRAQKTSITYLQLFLQFNPLLNSLSLSALSSANLFACLLWGYS